jgi:hypothetical protein
MSHDDQLAVEQQRLYAAAQRAGSNQQQQQQQQRQQQRQGNAFAMFLPAIYICTHSQPIII